MARAIHVVATVAVALAGATAALAFVAWIAFQLPATRRLVRDQVARALETSTGARLGSARLSGSLFDRLIVEDLALDACGQGLSLHARRVEVQYRLVSLLTGDPHLRVIVDEPKIERAPVCPAPPLPTARVTLDELVVHQGEVPGLGAIEMIGSGSIELERGAVKTFALHVRDGSARLFSADSESHVEWSGDVGPGSVSLTVTAAVTRGDLAHRWPAAAASGPIAASARIVGPPATVALAGSVRSAFGTVALVGAIDVVHRTAELWATSPKLSVEPPAGGTTLVARFGGHLHATIERFDLRASGRYRRRALDVATGAEREQPAGGSFTAVADGRIVGPRELRAAFRVEIDEVGHAARLAGATAASPTVLHGTLELPPSGRARFALAVDAKRGER